VALQGTEFAAGVQVPDLEVWSQEAETARFSSGGTATPLIYEEWPATDVSRCESHEVEQARPLGKSQHHPIDDALPALYQLAMYDAGLQGCAA
jgi:hypothetical protein